MLFSMVADIFIFWAKSHVRNAFIPSLTAVYKYIWLFAHTHLCMHALPCMHTRTHTLTQAHIFSCGICAKIQYSVFLCHALSFSVMHQNFKWEEQNFVVQNEINNMEFLVTISNNTRSTSKVGTDTSMWKSVEFRQVLTVPPSDEYSNLILINLRRIFLHFYFVRNILSKY